MLNDSPKAAELSSFLFSQLFFFNQTDLKADFVCSQKTFKDKTIY